tara:strand:- start:9219 stop:9881 length:663 start_codon:yes stop_codon:yes gene_type:complete
VSSIRLREQSTAPADAASGQVQMYAKTDGELYVKQGGNSEQNLATASDISELSLGQVLNVVQTVRTTRLAISSSTANLTFTDGSLSASLTPASSSNKILVTFAFYATHADSESSQFWLLRSDNTYDIAGGTIVVQGDASGSATRVTGGVGESNYSGASVTEPASLVHFEYLDSPASASEVSYGIRGKSTSGTMYVGGTANTSDADAMLFPSSITLKEIRG